VGEQEYGLIGGHSKVQRVVKEGRRTPEIPPTINSVSKAPSTLVRGLRIVMIVSALFFLGGVPPRPPLDTLSLRGGGRFPQRFPPNSRRWVPDTKLPLQLFNVLSPAFLPVNCNQASRAPAAPERPWDVLFQPILLWRREPKWGSDSRQSRHWQSKIREFESLHDNFVLDAHGHGSDTVVQVVTFTIPLHHVGKFWIVDVTNLWSQSMIRKFSGKRYGGRTGALLSGVTPHRSSQVMYERPNVPSGRLESASMSTVCVFILGRSLRIALPSSLASILSRKRGRTGPAVNSPNAATISNHNT